MSKIKQAIESQSRNYKKWYKKNSWVFKLVQSACPNRYRRARLYDLTEEEIKIVESGS